MHLSHTAALELIMGDSLNHKALGLSLVAALVSYTIAKKWPMSKAFEHIPMRPVKTKGPLGWLIGHQADETTNAYGGIDRFFMTLHGEDPMNRVAVTRIGRRAWPAATHPADISYIHNSTNYRKPFIYKQMLGRMMGDGLVTLLGVEEHSFHRRVMAPAFSPAALKAIADEVVPKHAGIFMEAIRTHAKDGKRFVIQNEFHDATIRVMADAIFKTEDMKDSQEIISLFKNAVEGQWCLLRLIPGMDSLLFARNKQVGDAREGLSEKVRRTIANVRQSSRPDAGKASTVMEHLVRTEKLSDRHLLDHGVTLMFAGQDTSQTTLTWLASFLARNPSVQAKLYEELCDAIGKNKQCKLDDLKNCKYLLNCIKETSRLRLIIGVSARVALEDDVLPATKTFIPKGTEIQTSLWVPTHHPDIWGADAEEFRPERWDEFTPEQQDLVDLAWLPFSSGIRSCIGKEFAMNEMLLLGGALVRNFELRWPEGQKDPVLIQSGIIIPQEPIELLAVERDQ